VPAPVAPAPVPGVAPSIPPVPAPGVAPPIAPVPVPGVAAPLPPAPVPAAPAPAPLPPNNATSAGAIQLQPEVIVNGGLEGSTAGRFAYYKFTYKGDKSPVTINLQVEPDDALVLKNAGFKLYGPNPGKEYVVGGAQKGLVPNVAGNLIGEEVGEYVVQVYNYNPQTAVGFALLATGLPAQPAPAAPRPAAPAPASAPVSAPAPATAPAAAPTQGGGALATQNSFRGRLAPGAGGHFALFEFNYPGNREVYTINAQISPDEGAILEKAGFKVYGPQKDKVYLEGGARKGLTPNVSGNLISREGGNYVVQVYNYHPTAWVDYEVNLVAGPPPGEERPPA
jgi:hypothetical protein